MKTGVKLFRGGVITAADAIAAAFPPGVVNFISGSGRKTMGPIMKTGLVDMLGFIGGSKAADSNVDAIQIEVGGQTPAGKGAAGRLQAASTTLRQFGNGAQGFNRATIPLQQQAECHGADIRCADQPETGKFFLAVHPACIGE